MGNFVNHFKGAKARKVKQIRSRFLAQNITTILPTNSWAGKTCFIIGGGPSLEGFDWSLLSGYPTIGINKTFQQFFADINYSMDYNFFDLVQHSVEPKQLGYELHKKWLEYKGIKLFIRQDETHGFAAGIYYVKKLFKKAISFDLNAGIYPMNNSGGGALMLALALGCKNIGLLGYDFKVKGNKTHWHDGYSKQNVETLARNLEDFRSKIDEFAPFILELGINVVNLSSDSNLRNFPFSDIKTFKQSFPSV